MTGWLVGIYLVIGMFSGWADLFLRYRDSEVTDSSVFFAFTFLWPLFLARSVYRGFLHLWNR